jgi:hypothetical protein
MDPLDEVLLVQREEAMVESRGEQTAVAERALNAREVASQPRRRVERQHHIVREVRA